MELSFSPISISDAQTLVVAIGDGGQMTEYARQADAKMGGLVEKTLKAGTFEGKKNKFSHIVSPAVWDNVVLVGLGKPSELTEQDLQNMGGALVSALNHYKVKSAAIVVDGWDGAPFSPAECAAFIAAGARLGSYTFHKYKTTQKEEEKPTLISLTVMVEDPKAAQQAYTPLDAVVEGVFTTRNLVSEPANIIHPESLSEFCKDLTKDGIKVEVLGEKEMKKLGMNALLGVGQGSSWESKLVVMQYNGAPKSKEPPVAFVGKGVTFDSGGISIKPSGGMEEMKWDMGGSAVVIGLMKALAGRKANVNAIGVVGLVENMPSGTAQRPGDVVTSMSGQTIEVVNTDAEGRLVLADALWYTQDRFKPQFIINLATLTGAIVIALGSKRAGIFANDDTIAERLHAAGETVNERVWRLPLGEEYDKQINCDIADMKNVGEGREAGSITAAQFLQRFVNDTPWCHIDIAGVTWTNKGETIVPKGGSGFGVRLLDRFVANHYEDKE